MRRDLLFIAIALLAYACSNDAGTNPFLLSDAAIQADAGDRETGPDNIAPGCLGCSAGDDCFNGDQNEQCGSGGEACVACGDDEVCSEAGACVAPPSCNRDTCTGCCDADGQCQAGTDLAACGVSGLDCAQCPSGGTCSAGICRQPCGPTTCSGCCDATGQCVTGATDDRCGAAGASCADCSATGGECSAGQCVSTACADSCAGCCDGDNCIEPISDSQCGGAGMACVDCGAGRTCTAQACAVDLASSWAIFLVAGEVGAMNASGGSWDGLSGLPDPYVIARFANQPDNISESVGDTLAPQWNATLVASVSAADLLAGFELLYRDDDAAFDDEICDIAVILGADDVAFNGGVVESSCPDAALGKVVWRLDALP